MASPPLTYSRSSDSEATWDSLKRAILASSGFQRWYLEKVDAEPQDGIDSDSLVMRYLRETLETLAY